MCNFDLFFSYIPGQNLHAIFGIRRSIRHNAQGKLFLSHRIYKYKVNPDVALPKLRFTGISLNPCTCLPLLTGSGNLYPALNDTVVGTCIAPNKLPEVISKHNLEASII
jgi:hypothetical protein